MYRQLGPEDMAAVMRHYLSLCPRDRSLRFGVAKSDEAIARYCDTIDWAQARLIGYFARKRLCGLIELSAPLSGATPAREGAIVVAPGWRRRGVGRRLMRMAAVAAKRESCDRVLFFWQDGNDGFGRFLAACGGIVEGRGGSGWIDLSRPMRKASARQAALASSPPAVRHAL